MKPIKSSQQAFRELEKTTDGVAGDTILSAKCLPYLLSLVEKLVSKAPDRDYQLFIAYQTRIEGKPFGEAIELWRQTKMGRDE